MRNMVILLVPLILAGLVRGLKDPICGLEPADAGFCRAAMPRFTYYPSSNTCKNFIYGGCPGNENRFMTKELCEAKCVET